MPAHTTGASPLSFGGMLSPAFSSSALTDDTCSRVTDSACS
jgi:hypothetical protein